MSQQEENQLGSPLLTASHTLEKMLTSAVEMELWQQEHGFLETCELIHMGR